VSSVSIRGLTKEFEGVTAVNALDLDVAAGVFVTLLGPSGCGKTSTLRCIAGLERPTAGTITIGDQVVSSEQTWVPPERRGIAMVFQSYAIWPHMTVYDNVAYGLRIRQVDRRAAARRVERALETVSLKGLERRYPSELSGGQQQRVALARCIVVEPSVLLFDEPLSNLDAKLRERMRIELRQLQQRLEITSIYVTHDQAEAMALSDHIVLMDKGVIVQQGAPEALYRSPRSAFAADFLGSSCFLEGQMGDRCVTTSAGLTIAVNGLAPIPSGERVTVGVRPESVELVSRPRPEAENCWHAEITARSFLGDLWEYRVRLGDGPEITARLMPRDAAELGGGSCYAHVDPSDVFVFPSTQKPGSY
jgi:iron(III) transport system ATP-binding protein